MNLKKERVKLGMTQRQFAALINYAASYYASVENGFYKASPRMLTNIKLSIQSYKEAVK